jgi:hypothetical protein
MMSACSKERNFTLLDDGESLGLAQSILQVVNEIPDHLSIDQSPLAVTEQ